MSLGRVNPHGYDSFIARIISIIGGANRQAKILSPSLHVPVRPTGTHAYMVTYEGAKKLLRLCPKANYHVDIVVRKFIICPVHSH